MLFEMLAVLAFIVLASLGVAAVYYLIMGGLQKDKKKLMVGLICLAGFVVCAFIGLLFIGNLIRGMC